MTDKTKETKEIGTTGNNINELKKSIKKAVDQIIALKANRASVNADIQAIRSNMESQGISKKAFDAAMSYYEKDPDDRDGYDLAYAIAREAVGLPVQSELFD